MKNIILAIFMFLLLAVGYAFAVELDGDTNSAVDIDKGGTNATSAANARTNLGAVNVAGDTGMTGEFQITSQGAAEIPITIKGASGQTGRLLKVINNSNEEIAYNMLWSGAAYSEQDALAAQQAKIKFAV